MSRKNILIIIIVTVGIFILLMVVLFLNSFLANKNSGAKLNPAKIPVSVNTPTKKSTTSATIAPSLTEVVVAQPDISIVKALIAKQNATTTNPATKTIADISKNVADCSGLKTEADINSCVTLWAEYNKDPGLCVKATAAGQQDCQDRGYLAQATADKNISLCANIKGSDFVVTCVSNVVNETKIFVADCMKLPDILAKLELFLRQLAKINFLI